MKFRLCTLASGSSGNCTYIEAGTQKFLVDAGVSGKKIILALEEIGVLPTTINGILVTHEHIDHIKSVGILSRKLDIPIYATHKTWDKIINDNMIGKVQAKNIIRIDKETYLDKEELRILAYSIYHDAVDPVGYIFEYKNKKISVATDLGRIDDNIKKYLDGSNGILIEFNHDVRMLEAGGYPYYLKKRILGDEGHLNNEDAARALVSIYHSDLKWAVLGHLSKDNNIPDLAYLTAKTTLEDSNIIVGQDIEVVVADRESVSKIFDVL